MAAIGATYLTTSAKGIREDLTDMIWNIAPTQTPMASAVRKMKAAQTKHEWQTDTLATAAANAQAEGDDFTTSLQSATATVRLANYCQISYKTAIVSATLEAVNKAGRKSELAYQIAKKGKELKRDIEFALANKQTGASTDPRALHSLPNILKTNISMGSGGANGDLATLAARTDGTQRAFTEAMLKDVLKQCFTSGGEPDTIMVGPFNKQTVSGFTGNATRTVEGEDMTLYAAISVYKSDYGQHKVIPNRFQRERDAFVLEMEKWGMASLRPISIQDLAKTGDAEKKLIVTEYTLEASNEAASGMIADLTTS